MANIWVNIADLFSSQMFKICYIVESKIIALSAGFFDACICNI